ncbi:MAG: transposase [Phycisphaerae bacterium]|nr:transposase [Phycisphaerae bacterium]
MTYDPNKHQRRSIRLREYDYSQPGAYFLTICSHEHQCLFGHIVDTEMKLNDLGLAVQSSWLDIPNHYHYVELDEFVIMPNHLHAIVVLQDTVGAGFKPAPNTVGDEDVKRAGFKPAPTRHSLGEIVRAFKTFSARHINKIKNTPGKPIWQRNYFEHIIRNEESLNKIRNYIMNNPRNWTADKEQKSLVEFIKSLIHPTETLKFAQKCENVCSPKGGFETRPYTVRLGKME